MTAVNVTFHAKWLINEYTLTFDPTGGSAVAAVTQDYNTDVTITYVSAKTGYTFTGWNTKADGTGIGYAKDDILKLTADVTLYALWSEDRTITGTETDDGTSTPITPDDASVIGNVISNLGNIEIIAPASVYNDIIGDDINSSLRLSQNGINGDVLKEVVEKIGDDNAIVVNFDLSLEKVFSDGNVEKIHNFSGNLKVTVTLTADQLAEIASIATPKLYWYNPETGTLTDMDAEIDLTAGTATFYTDHFSTFVISGAVKTTENSTDTSDAMSNTVTTNEDGQKYFPNTGDNTPYATMLGALISSLLVMMLAYPKKKKKCS